MYLNVPPEISLSLFCMPDATQWRKSSALKCDGYVMAVMKAVKFAEVCYCSVLSRMALATSLLSLFSYLLDFVSIQTDVVYIIISLIVIIKAKT